MSNKRNLENSVITKVTYIPDRPNKIWEITLNNGLILMPRYDYATDDTWIGIVGDDDE